MVWTVRAMAPRRPCSGRPRRIDLTRIAQRHGGGFPIAEITASIDGRTAIPAHGSPAMPVWGVRFGEIAEGGWTGESSPTLTEGVVRGALLVLIEYLQSIQQ